MCHTCSHAHASCSEWGWWNHTQVFSCNMPAGQSLVVRVDAGNVRHQQSVQAIHNYSNVHHWAAIIQAWHSALTWFKKSNGLKKWVLEMWEVKNVCENPREMTNYKTLLVIAALTTLWKYSMDQSTRKIQSMQVILNVFQEYLMYNFCSGVSLQFFNLIHSCLLHLVFWYIRNSSPKK